MKPTSNIALRSGCGRELRAFEDLLPVLRSRRRIEIRILLVRRGQLLVLLVLAFVHGLLEAFDRAAEVRADRLQPLGAENQSAITRMISKLTKPIPIASLPLKSRRMIRQ